MSSQKRPRSPDSPRMHRRRSSSPEEGEVDDLSTGVSATPLEQSNSKFETKIKFPFKKKQDSIIVGGVHDLPARPIGIDNWEPPRDRDRPPDRPPDHRGGGGGRGDYRRNEYYPPRRDEYRDRNRIRPDRYVTDDRDRDPRNREPHGDRRHVGGLHRNPRYDSWRPEDGFGGRPRSRSRSQDREMHRLPHNSPPPVPPRFPPPRERIAYEPSSQTSEDPPPPPVFEPPPLPPLQRTSSLPPRPPSLPSRPQTLTPSVPPSKTSTLPPLKTPAPPPVASSSSQSTSDPSALENKKPVRRRTKEEEDVAYGRNFQGSGRLTEYEILNKLGEGTFGEVHRAKHTRSGTQVALKRILMHNEREGMPITALREIKILKALQHENVVKVLDVIVAPRSSSDAPGSVYMVFPYMDHDLAGLLENPNVKLSYSQIKLYMKQILEGTHYLHINHILHRDMKAANLLISNSGSLQLADFGLSRPFDPNVTGAPTVGWDGKLTPQDKYTNCVVTRWYRPPELLLGARRYGGEVDIWGVGCIMGEMFTRRPILPGVSDIDQLDRIWKLCGSPTGENWPEHTKLPGCEGATWGLSPRAIEGFFQIYEVSADALNLIERLLEIDPRRRISAGDALDHAYFWTDPLPADPKSLIHYEASHEYDRRKRAGPDGAIPMPGLPLPSGAGAPQGTHNAANYRPPPMYNNRGGPPPPGTHRVGGVGPNGLPPRGGGGSGHGPNGLPRPKGFSGHRGGGGRGSQQGSNLPWGGSGGQGQPRNDDRGRRADGGGGGGSGGLPYS